MTDSSEYVLVDGYNVIFSWKKLSELSKYSLEDARLKLMDILCDYQGYKQNHVVLIFDAHLTHGGYGSEEHYNNIKVVYTKESETADNFIERAAADLRGRTVRVVTSDYTEQIIILGKGATRISAQEFQREVERVRHSAGSRYINSKPAKKNQLMDLLDPQTASLLETMRLTADEEDTPPRSHKNKKKRK
ncbi:MAG: NYN domain-containing protein [Clostridiales bacterium]|nr:NYN domain-containing protein [Clostridiales bacterium]